MFDWFFRKKGLEIIKEDTKKGFETVKRDINSVIGWIKHLDSEKNLQKKDLEEIKLNLSSINDEIEGIKNILSIINQIDNKSIFKNNKRVFNQQTAVYPVQTAVQTAVQTQKLEQFSITERAIIWILLNSDTKLSYDDLSVMLGKEKSTIRGQINTIKQKSETLINESIEKNGKKRVFIPENMKEILLKRQKVRVNKNKINKNAEKTELKY